METKDVHRQQDNFTNKLKSIPRRIGKRWRIWRDL